MALEGVIASRLFVSPSARQVSEDLNEVKSGNGIPDDAGSGQILWGVL